MNVVEQEIPMVVVPPPFWQCFGGFLPCASSPMIVTMSGKAGAGKSELAVAIASEYRKRGWYTVYLLLEHARDHVARHTADVDEFLRVQPSDLVPFCESFQNSYQKRGQPTIVVVDSIAVLGEGEARIGARRNAINQLTVWAAKNLYRFPTILLLIAQYRQGPALPQNPLVVTRRGSFADSNRHTMHVVAFVSQEKGGGGIKIEIDSHSLALYQKGKDGKVYAAPFQEDFKCVTVSISSPYQLNMPPLLYFSAVVRAYEVSSAKKKAKKDAGSGDSVER